MNVIVARPCCKSERVDYRKGVIISRPHGPCEQKPRTVEAPKPLEIVSTAKIVTVDQPDVLVRMG